MQSLTAFPFTSELSYDEKGWPSLDRAVGAETLRNVLKNYYTDGIFATANASCFQASAPTDGSQTVVVAPGVGLIQGATGYSDAPISLELTPGDGSLPRIDTVVLRLNDNTDFRNMYLDIITGTPASSPTAPALTQSDSIYELGLANLYRQPNSAIITDSNITDTRLDTDRCGQVVAIVGFDTSVLMKQLNAYYTEFTAKCETDYQVSREEYLQQCEEIVNTLNTFETGTEADVMEWFEHIKGQLGEDAAVNLQNQIDAITAQRFNDLYGLIDKSTLIRKDAAGNTIEIVETDQSNSAEATTTFEKDAEGNTAKIITVVVPSTGTYKYTKTTEFEAQEDGGKLITESYERSVKA